MKLIPILPAGKHQATDGRVVDITPVILQEMASNYEPTLSEAPFVCGHPKTDAPAYGWAATLAVVDNTLACTSKQVYPAFAEAVNNGNFKKRSASIYLPDTPGNPKPGQYYLKHIGFLGAVPPAIKGMPDITFAEIENLLVIEFSESSFQPIQPAQGDEAKGAPAVPLVEPNKQTPAAGAGAAPTTTPTEKPVDTTTQQGATDAKKEETLAAREAAVTAKEQAIAKAEAEAQRKEAVEYAEGLVKKGQLLPRQKQAVAELLLAMPTDKSLEFSEGDQAVSKEPVAVLRELLEAMPVQVNFAEKSAEDGANLDKLTSNEVAKKAQEYQAEQEKLGIKISAAQAVAHILKGNK